MNVVNEKKMIPHQPTWKENQEVNAKKKKIRKGREWLAMAYSLGWADIVLGRRNHLLKKGCFLFCAIFFLDFWEAKNVIHNNFELTGIRGKFLWHP